MPYKDIEDRRRSSREAQKRWYDKQKDDPAFRAKNTARMRKWVEANRERHNENVNRWRREFRDEDYQGFRDYVNDASKKNRENLRDETFAAYGGCCQCCGVNDPEFLTIDHIGGGGTAHRKSLGVHGVHFYRWLRKQGYPQDVYRCLCMNCNWAIRFGGICPHKRVQQAAIVTPEAPS